MRKFGDAQRIEPVEETETLDPQGINVQAARDDGQTYSAEEILSEGEDEQA